MAWTVAQAFNEFDANIKADDDMMDDVRSRRDTVLGYLKSAFPASANVQYVSGRLIGSFGRRTAARPFEDIDVMAQLSVDNNLWLSSYQGDSTNFLYRIRQALNNGTSIKKVGARGQAVRLFYQDGLYADVAAMVKYSNGGYGIPDGSGGWLTTDPVKHEEYVNSQNSSLSGDLKKIARFAKKWNAAHSSRLRSFHLEMMVARTFGTLGSNSRTALRLFFDYNSYNLSVLDPAGYSGDLSTYLDYYKKQAVNESLSTAASRAQQAIDAEDAGNTAEAIRQWRIILGSSFPTYG